MRNPTAAAIAALLLLVPTAFSETINIPFDFDTIQEGISDAEEGDTVLVQPGVYNEYIVFAGVPIVVASLRLTTGEDEFIERTIIDGDSMGRSVVAIRDGHVESSVLDGFTIRNGSTDYGGGVYIRGSSPTLRNLIISNNNADRSGGGIYCTRGGEPTISNVIMRGNQAFIGGGGLASINGSHPVLDNCIITANEVDEHGGGVHCTSDGGVTMVDCEVTDNIAPMYGGGVNGNAGAILRLTRVLLAGNSGGLGGGLSSRAGVGELTLTEVISRDNEAVDHGGGMLIEDCPGSISDCIISGNTSVSFGGGMSLLFIGDEIELSNCLVTNNVSQYGGGIYSRASTITLSNFTISGNSTEGEGGEGGGIFVQSENVLTIENSILWGNDGPELVFDAEETDTVRIEYCDIEGGIDSVIVGVNDFFSWGAGNMDLDPRFLDPDEDNFDLNVLSPCIDTGDPDSPVDMDSSRADMGTYYFHHISALRGTVTDAGDDSPLEGVLVETSDGRTATTDAEGAWFIANAIPRPFDIRVTLENFNPAADTLELEAEDTLDVNFALTHPGFELSLQRVEEYLYPNEQVQVEFTLTNTGNGPLDWTTTREWFSQEVEPWELRDSHNIDDIIEDAQISGVVFTGEHYLLTGSRGDQGMIATFDHRWNLVDTSFQDNNFFRDDLAWDDENNYLWLYSRATQIIVCYELADEAWEEVLRINPGELSNCAMAWDSDREILWVAEAEIPSLSRYDLDGDRLASIDCPPFITTGLAYWSEDPDDHSLYFYHERDSRQIIHKMNPDTGDTLFVADLTPDEEYLLTLGAEITTEPSYNWTMLTVERDPDSNSDVIDSWQLAPNPSWISLEPSAGILEAEGVTDLTLTLTSDYFLGGLYHGIIWFHHTAEGGLTMLAITMSVDPSGVGGSESDPLPLTFDISGIYPNPFNSQASVRFSLPFVSKVELSVFDLSGRRIQILIEDELKAGAHEAVIDASTLPSGLYLVKLTSLEMGAVTRRMVVIR